jgi:hypothetical protein
MDTQIRDRSTVINAFIIMRSCDRQRLNVRPRGFPCSTQGEIVNIILQQGCVSFDRLIGMGLRPRYARTYLFESPLHFQRFEGSWMLEVPSYLHNGNILFWLCCLNYTTEYWISVEWDEVSDDLEFLFGFPVNSDRVTQLIQYWLRPIKWLMRAYLHVVATRPDAKLADVIDFIRARVGDL